MIKALIFDIDGTLLNSERKISPKTKEVLIKCVEKGYKLFFATARPPLLDRMASWNDDAYTKEQVLSIFHGGLYYNGGCVKIGEYKDYIFISDEIVHKAICCVQNYDNLNIALQSEGEKHSFRFPLEDNNYKNWGIIASESLTLNQGRKLKTIKIFVFYSNLIDSVSPLEDCLVSSLKDICEGNAQFYLTDRGTSVQIMGKSISKLTGIEKIRNKLGYKKNEIAVFGDDFNDIEMLSEYPFSVAMGNAEAQVKAVAKYVTLDNDNDGIYEAIYNILKLM